MLDLYEKENNEALARMPGTSTPEAGAFEGFFRGSGMGAVRTAIKYGARNVAAVGSIGAIAYDRAFEAATGIDTIADGTSARDRYFKTMDEIFDPAIDYWTPKPGEVGIAGEVVGQLLGLLPIVIASPAFAVAGTQLDTAIELAKKGVGDWRAQAVGAAQAVGLGAGIWMPILGQTFTQRVLLGGAGFNVVQGVATRGASELILADHPAAAEFKALDGTALTLDVLLGMAFGGISHLSPAQRAQGASAWERIRDWTNGLAPSQKAAIMVLREGQHLNVDSLPGKPLTALDQDAHVQLMRTALDQVIRGEPVNTAGMRKPAFEADEARWLEATHRAEELRKESARIVEEYGLAPEELQPIRTEGPPAQRAEPASPPPPEAGTKAKPGGPEAEPNHLGDEALAFAKEYPDLPIRTGQDANGEPQTTTLKGYLEGARAEAKQKRSDASLFEVAAACMLGAA